jgi:sugar lactone lactonase YvrE
MSSDTEILLAGLAFPESPRWRENRLWFTDQHARQVLTVTLDGQMECQLETEDLPGGLGWLPDGTLLLVAMTERKVYRLTEQGLILHADLSSFAPFHCNDMVVAANGRAYVGNFGYDLHGGESPVATCLVLVEPDGHCSITASGLIFPNGSVITPDGSTLIVAETFASRLTAFTLGEDGLLYTPRLWADLKNATPDGICLDAEGALWVASPGTSELLRVDHAGTVLARIQPVGAPYACMLGGPDRRTLFITTSETDDAAKARVMQSGRIEIARVAIPGAGLP